MMSFKMIYRSYGFSSTCRRNHYETLGVSPKATHSEIKSAYYKLSMIYHPDRQEGNREKFEKITDAYKVIGDHVSRGLYDRGAFQDAPSATPPRNYHAQSGPVRRSDIPTGKTPIYDFDLWSRAHYGQSMARRATAKARHEENIRTNKMKQSIKSENFAVGIIAIIMFTGCLSYSYNNLFDNFDKTTKNER